VRRVGVHESRVENFEIDLVSRNYDAFPAVAALLQSCKGTLGVSFGKLPWVSNEHIIRGIARLRPDLSRLSLRLFDCRFNDGDFAGILLAFASNQWLKELTMGLDPTLSLGELPRSAAAVRDVLVVNRTLQRLSIRGGRGLDAFQKSVLSHAIAALTTENRTLLRLDVRPMEADNALRALVPQIRSMLLSNDVFHTFYGFPMSDNAPAFVEVQHLLKLNRYGRRFLLRPELGLRDSDELWSLILANISRAGEHGVMFHFLRNRLGEVRTRRGVTRARGAADGTLEGPSAEKQRRRG
jgi:hypothetical protein